MCSSPCANAVIGTRIQWASGPSACPINRARMRVVSSWAGPCPSGVQLRIRQRGTRRTSFPRETTSSLLCLLTRRTTDRSPLLCPLPRKPSRARLPTSLETTASPKARTTSPRSRQAGPPARPSPRRTSPSPHLRLRPSQRRPTRAGSPTSVNSPPIRSGSSSPSARSCSSALERASSSGAAPSPASGAQTTRASVARTSQ